MKRHTHENAPIPPFERTADYHIYPGVGRPHVLTGVECWCRPRRDDEEPRVVIHRLAN